jgi:PII-like signaling protein
MDGCLLRIYLHEHQRYDGQLAWEWLLAQANALGIRGGSAFRAMAGFGHHHHVQEASFFELAGDLAIEVEFIVTESESEQLLAIIKAAGLRAFYAHSPARFGVVNPESSDAG